MRGPLVVAASLFATSLLATACSLFALDGFSGDPAPVDASTNAADATTANDANVPSSKYHAAVEVDTPYAYFPLDEATGASCASVVSTSVVCLFPSSQATRGVPGVGGSTAVHLDASTATLTSSRSPSR